MRKWDGLKKKLRKFSADHNLQLRERNYNPEMDGSFDTGDSFSFQFKCSESSCGHFSMNLSENQDQLMVAASLMVYDFESDLVKEKFFTNIKKPEPFEELKFMEFLENLIAAMMNFKGDDFDHVRKIRTHPMMATKEELKGVLERMRYPIME